jgi:hypothetical protein
MKDGTSDGQRWEMETEEKHAKLAALSEGSERTPVREEKES